MPVELNSLLYRAETDLEWMSRELGHDREAREWHARAIARRKAFDK